jgi:hypothetical protein
VITTPDRSVLRHRMCTLDHAVLQLLAGHELHHRLLLPDHELRRYASALKPLTRMSSVSLLHAACTRAVFAAVIVGAAVLSRGGGGAPAN